MVEAEDKLAVELLVGQDHIQLQSHLQLYYASVL